MNCNFFRFFTQYVRQPVTLDPGDDFTTSNLMLPGILTADND